MIDIEEKLRLVGEDIAERNARRSVSGFHREWALRFGRQACSVERNDELPSICGGDV